MNQQETFLAGVPWYKPGCLYGCLLPLPDHLFTEKKTSAILVYANKSQAAAACIIKADLNLLIQ